MAHPSAGLRRALKVQLLESPDGMADADLLRLVLARAMPRDDPGPLAVRLLDRFGRFSAVINASAGELRQVHGMTTGVVEEIALTAVTSRRLTRGEVMGRCVVSSWSALLAYVRTQLAGRAVESFHVLFLDVRNQLIADEEMGRGTVDHAPVYPREIIKRALELSAKSLILVHNHPGGEPTPSRADIEVTKQVVEAGRTLGLQVHDHVIVGASDVASFKALGLI